MSKRTVSRARAHRDPTGMTMRQAIKEAELRFTKHPTLRVVYRGDKIEVSVHACSGQAIIGGRKTTRGCGHDHPQPCPGGPLVYQIARVTSGSMGLTFKCIEARGDSWQQCLDKIDARREEDKKRAEEARKRR